jgi:hypothetical protein
MGRAPRREEERTVDFPSGNLQVRELYHLGNILDELFIEGA